MNNGVGDQMVIINHQKHWAMPLHHFDKKLGE